MSALRLPESPSPAQQLSRPRLVAARAARRVERVPFAASVVMLLALGILGVLVIQTRIQAQGFELVRRGYEASALTEREASLRTQLDSMSASGELMRRASGMGMVPAGSPAYLTLADGKVVGASVPAGAADLRTLKTRDQQITAAKAKADAEAKAAAEAAAKAKAEARAKADAAAAAAAAAAAGIEPSLSPSPRPASAAATTPAARGR